MALARQIGDRPLICQCLLSLGGTTCMTKDYQRAEAYLQEGLALARQIEYKSEMAQFLINLGIMNSDRGNQDQARIYLQEGLALTPQALAKAALLNNPGLVATRRREYEQAKTYFQEGLDQVRPIGNVFAIANILNNYGELNLKQLDMEGAAARFQEVLESVPPGNSEERRYALFGLARVRLAQGKYEEARHLGQESLAIFEAIEHEKDKAAEIRQWLRNAFSFSQ